MLPFLQFLANLNHLSRLRRSANVKSVLHCVALLHHDRADLESRVYRVLATKARAPQLVLSVFSNSSSARLRTPPPQRGPALCLSLPLSLSLSLSLSLALSLCLSLSRSLSVSLSLFCGAIPMLWTDLFRKIRGSRSWWSTHHTVEARLLTALLLEAWNPIHSCASSFEYASCSVIHVFP